MTNEVYSRIYYNGKKVAVDGYVVESNGTASVKNVSATVSTLETSIDTNASAISGEISRATGIEAGLRTDVDANETAITAEVTRATNAEGTLQTNIDAKQDAITSETKLSYGLLTNLPKYNNSDITSETNIPEVKTATWDGKQDALTNAQLSAVNSGIDATKVAQIATNATNIGTKVTANASITGATKCKITYDAKGLVTAGADLTEGDIPTLSKSKVGLDNVDNTSDANKPISTATQTALNGKQNTLGFTPENVANRTTSIDTATSASVKYPTDYAVQQFVNSSIATETATFRGNFPYLKRTSAEESEGLLDVAWQESSSSTAYYVTNNDYVFVQKVVNNVTQFDRYKWVKGSSHVISDVTTCWWYEYTLNNSSFTQAQWSAINSTITSSKVDTYDGYASTIDTKADTSALTAHTGNTNNPHSVTAQQIGVESGAQVNKIETVKVNGSALSISDKAVDITVPSIPNISKGTTTGNGNAVTDISVSGHTITLNKGTTFLTQHQTLPKYNGTVMTSSTDIPYVDTSKWNGYENTIANKANSSDLTAHTSNTNNPHSVTKAQVELENVTNVATESTITEGSGNNITSGAVYTALAGKVSKTGDETIDGSKTFTSAPELTTSGESYFKQKRSVSDSSTYMTLGGYQISSNTELKGRFYAGGTDSRTRVGISACINGDEKGIQIENRTNSSFATCTAKRSYSTASNDDILTKEHLESAITIGGAKTFSGQITRALTDSSAIMTAKNTNTGTYYNDIQYIDSTDVVRAFFRYAATNSSGGNTLHFSLRNTSGGRIGEPLGIFYTGSVLYATAPHRTYDSANTSDIVTIGMLNADMTVGGRKTFTANPYVYKEQPIFNLKTTTPLNTGSNQWYGVAISSNEDTQFSQYGALNKSDGVRQSWIATKSKPGVWNYLLLQTLNDGTAYVTAPSRAYASASNDDIIVKGKLEDRLSTKILYGTTDPTVTPPSSAVNGDIYIMYE